MSHARSINPHLARGVTHDDRVRLLDSVLAISSDCAIAAIGRDGSIIAWNRGAARLYGYESSHAIGTNAEAIFERIVVSPVWQQILDGARMQGEWSGEVKQRGRDGRRFTSHLVIALMRDSASHFAGFTVVARDLSLEMRSERAIREQQAFSENLFESNVDALVTTDTNGIVTGANQRMCTLTGCSRDDLIGIHFSHIDDRARANRSRDPARDDGRDDRRL